MTNQEKILNAIKTATSQQPIGMLALIDQLGIDGNTMADELEALYNAKRINRCLHTKDGITQQVVWPTNIVTNVKWGQFEITKPKPSATPPRQLAQPTQNKEATMNKPKNQIKILETIYANTEVPFTTRDLRKLVNIADIYQYISWYVENGYIKLIKTITSRVEQIQLTDKAPANADLLYTLRYPNRKPSPKEAETPAQELYLETVQAVQQADTFTEQIEIERKAANQWSEIKNDDDQQEYDEFTKRLSESMSHMADMHPLNSQVGGDHYKTLGIYQPWEVLARWMTPEELRGFAKGTVIAYLARERQKGGDQDIEKALHTLQLWQALKDINQPSNAEAA